MVVGRWGAPSGSNNGARRYFDGQIDYVSIASLEPFTAVLKSNSKKTNASSEEITEVTVFPNPTTGKLTIQVPDGLEGNLTWTLTSAIGTKVEEGRMEQATTFEMDISHLYEGTYILNLVNNDLGVVSKMITLRLK